MISRFASNDFTVLITGFLCFAAGGLYAWSAMIPALEARFATGSEQAGLVFSVSITVFSLAVLATPRLPDRMRGLTGVSVFGLAAAAFLALSGMVGDFVFFVGAYSVGFGFASGAIYICALERAANTSMPRRATALMVAAFGLGGAIFGPAQRLLVADGWGLKALWVMGAVLLLAALVGLVTPKRLSAEPDHDFGTDLASEQVLDDPKAARQHIFLLWIGFGFGSIAGLMVLGLATSIIETRGGAVWLSSLAIFGVAIGNTLGRASAGTMDKWLHIKWMIPISTSLSAAGLLLAIIFPTPEMSAIGLVAVATGYGLNASGFPILTRHFSGPTAFARDFALVFTAWGVAGLVSPWLAGRAYDLTSSFVPPLLAALVGSGIALVIALRLVQEFPKKPINT